MEVCTQTSLRSGFSSSVSSYDSSSVAGTDQELHAKINNDTNNNRGRNISKFKEGITGNEATKVNLKIVDVDKIGENDNDDDDQISTSRSHSSCRTWDGSLTYDQIEARANHATGNQRHKGFNGRAPLKTPGSPNGTNFTNGKTKIWNSSPGVGSKGNNSRFGNSPRTNSEIQLLLAGDGFSHHEGGGVTFEGLSPLFNSNDRLKTNSRIRNNKTVSLGKWANKPGTAPSDTGVAQGRHCDACAIDYVRHWLKSNSSDRSSGSRLRQSLTYPPSWEESKSGKHRKEQRAFYEPVQLVRERQLICSEGERALSAPLITGNRGIFVLPKTQKSADPKSKRPQANLHTVSVPKKGLIKLTGLAYEFENPHYFDDRKEIAEQRWYKAFQEETYGSPLPPPSCDAHRGNLIRSKSMIKQVKFGELRLRAEQEEEEVKSRATSATSNTSVKGLLQYEMPEVPNLNNNLKKFLGGKSNDDKERRHSTRHDSGHQRQTSGSSHQRKETSKNATKAISRNPSSQEPSYEYDAITAQVLNANASPSDQVSKYEGSTQHTNRLSFINLSYDNELKNTT